MPASFEFSQSCLQDYLDCPRRFWLKYIEQRSWPAEISEPVYEQEQHMLQGQAFHHLVQQYFLGIPTEKLEPYTVGDNLSNWWQNFKTSQVSEITTQSLVEYSLTVPFHGSRLIAKYDALQVNQDGSITILDWKTNRKKPGRERLGRHMQTRIYPYVLVIAGESLVGKSIAPELVNMIYWFADFPDDAEEFRYSSERFHEDRQILDELADHIIGSSGLDDFPNSPREEPCRYCVYRSYCDRGVAPGSYFDAEDEMPDVDQGLVIDFDNLPESAF